MIRIGLVGFGLAGRVFHAPLISSVEGLELAAVMERSTNLAAERYPGVPIHRTLESILADRSLELIVVATPSPTHYQIARQVLEAGFHAVVDKPMCAHSAQIAELAALAAARGRLLVPFHNRLWDGDFLTVRQLLAQGTLGRLAGFQSAFDRWSPGATRAAWKDAPRDGAGNLLDLGTHLAYQALALFGAPEAVWADIGRERPGEGADDAFTLRLRYPGLTVELTSNYLSTLPRPRFSLRGSLGGYGKTGVDPQEAALGRITRIEDPGWGRETEEHWGQLAVVAHGGRQTGLLPTMAGDYRLFYQAVGGTLRGEVPPPATAADAWRVARLLELARQSPTERREIACELAPPF